MILERETGGVNTEEKSILHKQPVGRNILGRTAAVCCLRQPVDVKNRGPEQENRGRDLRKTDFIEASILAPRPVC